MMIFQVLFVLFALVAIFFVFKRKFDGGLSMPGTVFWTFFWIGSAIAVLLPNELTVFANHLGIGRGTDLVLYVAIAMIFFVLFRLHVKLHRMEHHITTVVRKDTLDSVQQYNTIHKL